MVDFLVNMFRVTFLGASGTVGNNIGFIQLLNASTPRGYIQFWNIPDDQALPLDFTGSGDEYIVMNQRAKYLDAFLTVVKGPKPLLMSFSGRFSLLSSPVTVALLSEESSDAQAFDVGEQSLDPQGLQILQDLMAKNSELTP